MKTKPPDIDVLFRDALAHHEEQPPALVKESVFKTLASKKAKRYNISIALIVLLLSGLMVIGNLLMKQNDRLKATGFDNTDKNTDIRNMIPVYNGKAVNQPQHNISMAFQAHPVLTKTSSGHQQNNLYTEENISKDTLSYSKKSELFKEHAEIQSENSIYSDENQVNIKVNVQVPMNEKYITPTIDALLTQSIVIPEMVKINSEYKKRKTPLLMSAGIYGSFNLWQDHLLKLSTDSETEENSLTESNLWPSYSVGLNFRGERKSFYFETGLQYTSLRNQVSTPLILTNFRDENTYNLTGYQTNIDTSGGYYHYFYISDSVIRILDSVWEWKTDTSISGIYDTIPYRACDSLRNQSWQNTYTYLEIPLLAGWRKSFGRLNIGIGAGLIPGLLIGSKGSIPLHGEYGLSSIPAKTVFKTYSFVLSWQVSLNAGYFLSNRIMIEIAPYYRSGIINTKSANSSAVLRNRSAGCSLGFRFFF